MPNDELEKVKIDILRDSLKDVIDTIRALDKKIRYIISFNGLALGFIGSLLILYKKELDIEIFSSLSILGFLLLSPWVMNLIGLLWTFDPKVNPNNIFCSDKDKKSFNKCYFIPFTFKFLNWNPKEHIHLDSLVKQLDESIKDTNDVKLLLYKEISKLSYIRDVKIKNIKISLKITMALTLASFFILFYFAYLGNSSVKSNENNTTIITSNSNEHNLSNINPDFVIKEKQ